MTKKNIFISYIESNHNNYYNSKVIGVQSSRFLAMLFIISNSGVARYKLELNVSGSLRSIYGPVRKILSL